MVKQFCWYSKVYDSIINSLDPPLVNTKFAPLLLLLYLVLSTYFKKVPLPPPSRSEQSCLLLIIIFSSSVIFLLSLGVFQVQGISMKTINSKEALDYFQKIQPNFQLFFYKQGILKQDETVKRLYWSQSFNLQCCLFNIFLANNWIINQFISQGNN